MKKQFIQSDKEEIISKITEKMTVVIEKTVEHAVESLAISTNKGFAEVHERIDTLDLKVEKLTTRVDGLDTSLNSRIDDLQNDMNLNFAKVHQTIFALKIANDLE